MGPNTWEKERSHGPMIPAAAAKSLQSCPPLCDPIDGSPLGSPIPGIFQARTLECVAIFFSNAWKWKKVKRKKERKWKKAIAFSGKPGAENYYLQSTKRGKINGEGHGNLLQYSCLVNSMDRRAWWATGHEVAKSWTRLSNWRIHKRK